MTSESDFGAGRSFCGNCGAVVEPGRRACGVCGQPVADTAGPGEAPPRDYIPYCRSCGVGVAWGEGHACQRCGVAPLCALHFNAADGLCLDCAGAPAYAPAAPVAGGLRCGACGAALFADADFCSNCGRAVANAARAGVEYMGFWIRLAAFAVDRIIVYLIAAIIAAAIGLSRTSGEVDPNVQQDVTVSLETLNYSFLLMLWGISVVYGVLFTAWRGQTPGKMLMRVQVVDASGNIPPLLRVVARELVGKFVSEAIIWLGYIWIGWDENKRGWHDYLGRTYVVRKRRGSGAAEGGAFRGPII